MRLSTQILEILDDREEHKTGEILDAIDAHAVSLKKTLKKMVKVGLIIKVRHGTYRKSPTTEPIDDPEPEPSNPGGTSGGSSKGDKPSESGTSSGNRAEQVTDAETEPPDAIETGERLVRVWVNPIGRGMVSRPSSDGQSWSDVDVARDLPSYAGDVSICFTP